MSILEVTGLSHAFGDKKLFQNIELNLFGGDKAGLTGLNGVGKSTLINILIGSIVPDAGQIKWHPKLRVGYLDQHARIDMDLTVKEYLKGAFADLYETEARLERINEEITGCTDMGRMDKLIHQSGSLFQFLEQNNFFAIDSDINRMAAGLGIVAFGLDTPVKQLSGGQRAKVMLAKLLLDNPDMLLLDEPTNFLDKEHIEWLEKYLNSYKGSFLLVSHDFRFLNRVVNCIYDIEFFNMTRYNCNYEKFIRLKEERAAQYAANYNSQQKEIARLEDYVARNKARASTAAMAQSRQKVLDKMDRLDKPSDNAKPTFLFQYKSVSSRKLLEVSGLEVGYDYPLLPKIDLIVGTGERVAITGFNGIGKSTFLKTIAGLIPKLSGEFAYSERAVIGYFEQEHRWDNPGRTAIEEIQAFYPALTEKEARSWLAQCGVKRQQVVQSLSSLSGGEQAKVKLCKLILSPCNLLILDEPTNHLDVLAIEQLKKAIMEFKGGVIFVSHTKTFCEEVAQRTLDFEKLFDN